MYKNKGITIVSLVITIIILLILAGISIQALTGSGLFEKATYAKEQAKLAELEEQMNLAITEMIIDKKGGQITVDDYITHLKDKEKLNITDQYEEDGKKIIVVDDKYVFEIFDDEQYFSVEQVGVKDKLPPKLTLSNITNTTSSITVELTAKRNEGGKIEYYIKAEDEEEYVLKETQTDETYKYTYTGLEQNKKYNVKIVATAKNKQTAEILVERTTGNIPNIVEGDITFTYTVDGQEINKETWTNKDVTVIASTTITGYTLRTSTDGKSWSDETSQTFTANGKIYVALYDGTNYGGSATGNVTNIDTTKPIVTGATATTNSIEITATDEASGIIGYAVTTSDTEPNDSEYTSVTSTTSLSTTVSGKTQGTTYYVWVKDAAGNVSTSKSTATGNIPNLVEGDITFTYTVEGQEINKETWTNKDVTVTASTTITGYTLRTSTDGKSWSDETSQTFTANGKIYVALYDGTNYGGSATGNVTNIDTTKPIVTGATATTNSIEITATDEASGIIGYAVTTSDTEPNDSEYTSVTSTTSLSTTVSGKTQGTTYYVWVKDAAGNVSTSKSTATGKVTTLQQGDVIFAFNPSGWTNGITNVTATLKEGLTSDYTLKITDSDPRGANKETAKGWADASTGIPVSSNKTVYAILIDNEGQIGGAAAGSVTNIDTIAPTISTELSSTSAGIDSVSLSVGITDANSGLGKIEWYYGTTDNPTTLAGTTLVTELNGSTTGPKTEQINTATITGLSVGTTYYFKVIAYDVAGETTTSSVISASTMNPTAGDISYTPSDTSWNVDNVKDALDSLYNR